jgi:hypothetical protein
MNMDVPLDARRIVAPSFLSAQSIAARVRVENGRAIVQQQHAQIYFIGIGLLLLAAAVLM